jgi:acyl-coenzyme A synthetase/AMP-(fatty) acid ligase
LIKRAFSVAHPKFPTGTVAGLYKQAIASNKVMDAIRFDTQRHNWTLQEFDRYSSAFAHGLVESGYMKGDKLLLWVDATNSAELLVT